VVNSKKLIYEVKNWHDFQHDKREGRKMTWIKLYADLLDNQEFMNLDNDAQLLLIKCWLLACENQGKLPDVPEIAWRLRDKVDVVQDSFAKLSSFILLASKMTKSLAECQSSVPRGEESREEDRIEESKHLANFETFYSKYPNKVKKERAIKAWLKHKPDIDTVLKSLEYQVSNDRRFREKEFTPHPASWINDKEWENEPVKKKVNSTYASFIKER
jgi:hypothetical protein